MRNRFMTAIGCAVLGLALPGLLSAQVSVEVEIADRVEPQLNQIRPVGTARLVAAGAELGRRFCGHGGA